ncbi:MAG TPA: hypothetical protein VLF90_01135 [Patescibacteria group bacterium]|nr:hypothetical protein [Patescibacteria group bacterium]
MTEDEVITALEAMIADRRLVTVSAYRANVDVWPDNRISFIDSHVSYLRAHPAVNPSHYISNLKLRLRKNA